MIVAQSRRTLIEGLRRIVRVGLGVGASVVVVSFSVADRILSLIRRARARAVVALRAAER